jgi:hypothetical protein
VAYEIDLQASAQRHYDDARRLEQANRFDNAGYHYGLSTECAIKHHLRSLGIRADDDVMWRHFPELLSLAVVAVRGRRSTVLSQLLHPSLMQGWDIRMRYAKNGSIKGPGAERWRAQANRAIGLLYA